MHIKPPGAFARGKVIIGGPAPYITPESLLQELSRGWGSQGFKVYKSSLPGLDVAIKKSGWTGIAIKINQTSRGTELKYNAFAPSALVRMMFMGLIPLLIVNATSWKPLLRGFEQYVSNTPFFGGQMQGGQGQLPQGYAQPQPHQPQSHPCQSCRSPMQWVAQYQRWYCGQCQQYR